MDDKLFFGVDYGSGLPFLVLTNAERLWRARAMGVVGRKCYGTTI